MEINVRMSVIVSRGCDVLVWELAMVIHLYESQLLGGTQQCAFVWFGLVLRGNGGFE